MLKEIVIAIQSYIEAHRFIVQHKLWKWILIPGIIYSVLITLSMYFFSRSATSVIEYFTHVTGLADWIANFENGLLGFFFAFAGIILWLVLMFFYFSFFKYIWLILGSPLFAYLSEKTQSILERREYDINFSDISKDAARGVKLALRNCFWQTVYLVALLILSLVPVAGWVAPLIALFVECYYYGFAMLDYSAERNKLSVVDSIDFVGKHRGLAVGNGLLFYLMHALVLVGWVLAPAYAIIAGTLSMYKVKPS